MPLVSLDHVSLAFGHLPLLDDVSVQIEPRERVSIIGRNGTGKSTLLQVRVLVTEPDLLLLDEPTNHLDIEAITWLESFLAEYAGAIVFVTHDRAFLQRLATRVVELDRGVLTSWAGDYATFLRKKEEF